MTRRIPVPTPKQGRTSCRRAQVCGFVYRVWFAAPVIFAALLSQHAHGQEIPRPSYARQVQQTALPTLANLKVGEVLLRVDMHETTDFVDNVDLSQHGKSDMIVTPEIGLNVTWAVTKLNTLQFRAAIGYAYYMNNPTLNRQSMTIAPDTALNFNVYAGDVKINFHDQMSMQQESLSQGALSGIATLNRFTNTAGMSILWDTNDVVWNLAYDHYNFITIGGANSSSGTTASTVSKLDHSTDQVSASAAVKINSVLIGGIEAVGSYSDYPADTASNFSSISAGPYFEWQMTRYTHVYLSGGYKGYYSGANAAGSVSVSSTTAAQPSEGNPTGYYASLAFVHRLNRYYSDRLDFAHTDDVDALNGHNQSESVKYSGTWRINTKLNLAAGMYYENVRILAGSSLGGTPSSDYWRVGGSLGTSYQISQHVDASISYQCVIKTAKVATQDYTQNKITISLGYRF
jgi:hypothetical protein